MVAKIIPFQPAPRYELGTSAMIIDHRSSNHSASISADQRPSMMHPAAVTQPRTFSEIQDWDVLAPAHRLAMNVI